MSRIKYTSIVCVLQLASCATIPEAPATLQYELITTDNPTEYRFDVVLKSGDDRKLCLTREQWPSQVGQLHMGSNLARLETRDGVFPAADENFGYCPGGCGTIEIAPKGELKGFVAYAAFGEQGSVANRQGKKLQFSVRPFVCR